MARKPVSKPVERQEAAPAPNPNLVTNNTPGFRLWLADGRVLEYGESAECAVTAEALRARHG